VELDPAAVPQVLDHVPVNGADVLSPDERKAVADCEMDGAVDLLVEERVLHVLLDARVVADSELAQHASALVRVERRDQELLVAVGGRLDDPAALVAEPDAIDLVAGIARRVLREGDDPFGRVLERTVEDLAA